MTDTVTFKAGPWEGECLPTDGGRISRLCFEGRELFTPAPAAFRPPHEEYGEYETRPVYAYDDCFPSVAQSEFPGQPGVHVRDHGDVCWLPWNVKFENDQLTSSVRCVVAPDVTFTRTLTFSGPSITWRYEARNHGATPFPFIHAPHGLMPLDQVSGLQLPEFSDVFEEGVDHSMDITTAQQCVDHLLNLPQRGYKFILLHNVREGRCTVAFKGGLKVAMEWSLDVFPTLGVWWNNGGYPDEEGCRRTECIMEPVSGPWSSLARCCADQACQWAQPGERRTWEVRWAAEFV